MTVFDKNYLMTRMEELDAEIQKQQMAFMNAQQQVYQLNGAKQALLQLISELEVPTLTEDEVKKLAGADSIEFHKGEPPEFYEGEWVNE